MGVLIATINPVMTHLVAKTAYDLDGARAPNTWVLDNYSPGREERRG
jgi:multisubunit Na+/H+ antiporter MnhG subunit